MDLVNGLKTFVATAQTKSFTAAGKRLGISNRLTSKYLAELEARLGVRLLQRTTRKVGLTPAGEVLLARAPALLDEIEDMLAAITEDTAGFSGVLRISAPLTFGELYVKDMLCRFAEKHPDLVVDLRLSDTFVDLASEGIDLGFRVGSTDNLTVKTRKLCDVRTYVVASPEYLSRNGDPKIPKDLADHECIIDSNRRNSSHWGFRKNNRKIGVEVTGHFMVNSARAACDLAIKGRGIAYCPKFAISDALKNGELVVLLKNFTGDTIAVSAVYLEGRTLPKKIRALILT